jgi:hypothetical protein
MSKRIVRSALVGLFVLGIAACNSSQQPPGAPVLSLGAEKPDAPIKQSIELLKQGDIAGLMQNSLPPADYAKVKADWGKDNDERPVTDDDRRKFQDAMARLTAPDAENAIYADIEPQLKQFDAQYQQQIPMYVAMGSGWVQGMIQQNKDLSDAEKQQATAAVNTIAAWVQKTHFTDPDSVKKVLAIATRTARDLNLKTLDEARALNYDQAMQKSRIAVLAFKDALAVYGFSVDKMLDSTKTDVVSNDGTSAVVKIDYTLLDAPLTSNVDMVKVGDRWYGKTTIEKLKQEAQEARDDAKSAAPNAAPSPPSAPAATPPPASADTPAKN